MYQEKMEDCLDATIQQLGECKKKKNQSKAKKKKKKTD